MTKSGRDKFKGQFYICFLNNRIVYLKLPFSARFLENECGYDNGTTPPVNEIKKKTKNVVKSKYNG
jgi:hypothetical protein